MRSSDFTLSTGKVLVEILKIGFRENGHDPKTQRRRGDSFVIRHRYETAVFVKRHGRRVARPNVEVHAVVVPLPHRDFFAYPNQPFGHPAPPGGWRDRQIAQIRKTLHAAGRCGGGGKRQVEVGRQLAVAGLQGQFRGAHHRACEQKCTAPVKKRKILDQS